MTANLLIRSLLPGDPKWIEYVRSFPEATIFHHPNWMSTLAETYQYKPSILVVMDKENNILAGIPLLEVNSFLTGRQLLSLPFTDHCVPLSKSDHALRTLLDHLETLSKERQYKNIEVRWGLPDHPQISLYVHFVLSTIDLPSTTEEAFQNIQKRTQRYVRKAQRSNLTVKIGQSQEMMREFYKLQLLTRQKHGVPVQPWRFFNTIWEKLIQQDLGLILLAYQGYTCMAGMVTLHWQHTLTLKYGASLKNFQDDYPNYLLYWNAIQWGVENGYKKVDMGRSEISNSGLRSYKQKWGVQETPLTYSTYASIPANTSENKLMQAMKVIIQNSPALVCKVAGEILYKHSA